MSPTRRKVIVLGAGVSGLAAAHRIRSTAPDIELTVLEASDRAGGWIGTVEREGFVIERGADAILAQAPGFHAFVDGLGLRSRVVKTRSDRRGAYVLRAGRMERIPEGWSLLAPTSLQGLAKASLLSPAARLRVLGDLVMPTRTQDESLAAFARRRLGWEALERLGQPLAGGIYGSDAEVLGLEATLPRFAKLESEHGSVMRGLAKESGGAAVTGARYGLFCAFDRGMQVLIDALAKPLDERLRLSERATSLRATDAGFEVRTEHSMHTADAVVVALQGPAASALLEGLDTELGQQLRGVPHGSAATVTFAFDRSSIAHPLDAYGLVVPAVERRRILAMTWASEKWPDRAPSDAALIRVFVAGPGDGSAPSLAPIELDDRSDDELIRTALRESRSLLGIRREPRFSMVSRFPRAMPRYGLDHAERREAIERRLQAHPQLALAGNALHGVGIPAAIASGERAADQVLAGLASVRGAA